MSSCFSINTAEGVQKHLWQTPLFVASTQEKHDKGQEGKIDMEKDCTLHASCWQSESGDSIMEDPHHKQVIIKPKKR